MRNDFYFKTPLGGEFIMTNLSDHNLPGHLKKEDLYKIIWAKEDMVELNVDGYKLEIDKGSIMCCTPENRIMVVNLANEQVPVFLFNRRFYCIRDHDHEVSCNGLLFYGSSSPPVFELPEFELKCFYILFEMLEKEFRMKDALQKEMLGTILKQILIISTRTLREKLDISDLREKEVDLIRNFNLLVEKHFREKHKVKDYAEMLNMSPSSLSNFFHLHSQKSPLQIISERILLEAQRLIMFSDKSLSEIAFHLGFNDASHFSKFFKKNTGYSPKQYKSLSKGG